MGAKRPQSMEDQLRKAIRESGMPQNQICKSARVDEGTLSCFMLGKQESMRLKTAQRLARVLGMCLILEDAPQGNGAASKKKPAAKTKTKRRR